MPINFEPVNKKIDFTPQEDTSVATIDFQPEVKKPKKSIIQFLLEPISKQITGKSLAERARLVEKSQEELSKFGAKKGWEGKPPQHWNFLCVDYPHK